MSFPFIGKIFKKRKGSEEVYKALSNRLDFIEENQELIIQLLGEISVYCDKCGNSDDKCFKCGGSGIIKKKQLFNWPFL